MPADQQDAFARVKARARMTRFHGDCYIYALLAMGFIDVVVESALKRWDIAALIPIIEGAGGIITGWDGEPWREGSRTLACGDRRVHAQVMELLKG